MQRFVPLFVLLAAIAGGLRAEAPPCGIEIVRTQGSKIEERFVAADPEHVKFALLRAFPALAAKVDKDSEYHLEAKTDMELYQTLMRTNRDEGVHGRTSGLGAFGTFVVDIRPETQDGVAGAHLRVEFRKNALRGRVGSDAYAHPLVEETSCLAKILSTNDPSANPRGPNAKVAGALQPVALAEATPIKVLLRDPLYSKKLGKNTGGQAVQFEVADDVTVNGAVVIRRGALATGHFTKVSKAKGYGRQAEVDFAFDSATAVDGQEISVTGAGEKARGGRTDDTLATALMLPALGWLAKGNEAFIRAGTSYDLEVSGNHTVQAGR